jgi:hypothetical protein
LLQLDLRDRNTEARNANRENAAGSLAYLNLNRARRAHV